MALDMDKIGTTFTAENGHIIRTLREFKHLTSLKIAEIRPESPTDSRRVLNNFQYSIQALRKLEAISFIGEQNPAFVNKGMCRILPYLSKVKKIEGPVDGLALQEPLQFYNIMDKLMNVQEFKFEVAESTLAEPYALFNLGRWMTSLPFARKLTLVVTGAEFKVDLSVLNEIEVLEIVYQLSENLPALAYYAPNIENLMLPVSFECKINPGDTHNHEMTQALMRSLARVKNVKKMTQNYSFQDELSMLSGCYPIWNDVISYYNFQMLEILNIGVFLNDTIVDRFQTLFIESLRNMHRLRVLGLTLHNDGSSNKRFHLTGPILELTRVIGMLPCLSEFEFNTEIEIMLNILTEFFRGLTQLKNLRKFRSEWLQISQNSFKAFAKRLHQMKSLELLDIHLYSLYDIPKKDLDVVFSSLGDSLDKMPNLKAIQITADNECFAQENVWQQWQDTLRARCGKKFVELTLAETE